MGGDEDREVIGRVAITESTLADAVPELETMSTPPADTDAVASKSAMVRAVSVWFAGAPESVTVGGSKLGNSGDEPLCQRSPNVVDVA